MPEPFKNLFNVALVEALAQHIKRVRPDLDAGLLTRGAAKALAPLELKARSEWITDQLDRLFPADFAELDKLVRGILHPEQDAALSEMKTDAQGVRGWVIMPLGALVVRRGMVYPDQSLSLLEALTTRFSAEFAVRPFIDQHPKLAFKCLLRWAKSDNEHVRRLASEGCRPRLPWGMRLQKLVEDPAPILPVLKALRHDESAYVRKSVANNLNDIAKDHPQVVVDLCQQWLRKASKSEEAMIRHALRGLIKSGHPGALALLGAGPADIEVLQFELSPKRVKLGDAVTLSLTLRSASDEPQSIVLDYAVFHQKKNGEKTPGVFKWKRFTLPAKGSVALSKTHAFKPVTTRVYYNGEHDLELRINGQAYDKASCRLSGAN